MRLRYDGGLDTQKALRWASADPVLRNWDCVVASRVPFEPEPLSVVTMCVRRSLCLRSVELVGCLPLGSGAPTLELLNQL